MPPAHTVVSVYRPKPGSEAALLELVRQHVPRLRELGLVGPAPVTVLRSSRDGSLLEVFDWQDEAAVKQAHELPEVHALWEAFEKLCDCIPLSGLEEAGAPFAHFERVEL